jgi:transcriptional regulator with XRE-family HTH domain
MVMSAKAGKDGFATLRDEMLSESSELTALMAQTEPKREIALAFGRMRKQSGLSQKDIVERTGWDKGFVSRLEGAMGGMPDTETIARFAEACGVKVGLAVYLEPAHQPAAILDLVPLRAAPPAGLRRRTTPAEAVEADEVTEAGAPPSPLAR